MIKKCKQCGSQLLPGESNQFCENCRNRKREMQVEERIAKEKAKKKRG